MYKMLGNEQIGVAKTAREREENRTNLIFKSAMKKELVNVNFPIFLFSFFLQDLKFFKRNFSPFKHIH
jgi:hypothetical protein